ncbi:MAG: WG repeat-containing protein [Bacteroidales bacterium]|nr:WG repeat-containing protein [Candidatus Liminaster caballi]
MKNITSKLFFTVIWKGICQVMNWFFGLFGYNHDSKFAKYAWRIFSTSAAVVMVVFACATIYEKYESFMKDYKYAKHIELRDCEYVSRTIGYIPDYTGSDGYLIDKQDGRKVLKGIDWIAMPLGNDSLVCFSNGLKRGYFNKNSGEVAITAKYTHAWVFSEGIASVEENGFVKFIDSNGNIAFERTFIFNPKNDGYVFHGGYCIIDEDNDNKFGLIDANGITVLHEEYDNISVSDDYRYWILTKDSKQGLIDRNFKTIIPMMECNIYVFDDGIDVTMMDNTMRKYDLQGNLIDDFYITDFEYMEYELEETCQFIKKRYNEFEGEYEYIRSNDHKTARAHLAKYTAGNGKEGLITQDGHVVTLPKYEYIDAIGFDIYLCTVCHRDKEILNGKGQKVK